MNLFLANVSMDLSTPVTRPFCLHPSVLTALQIHATNGWPICEPLYHNQCSSNVVPLVLSSPSLAVNHCTVILARKRVLSCPQLRLGELAYHQLGSDVVPYCGRINARGSSVTEVGQRYLGHCLIT